MRKHRSYKHSFYITKSCFWFSSMPLIRVVFIFQSIFNFEKTFKETLCDIIKVLSTEDRNLGLYPSLFQMSEITHLWNDRVTDTINQKGALPLKKWVENSWSMGKWHTASDHMIDASITCLFDQHCNYLHQKILSDPIWKTSWWLPRNAEPFSRNECSKRVQFWTFESERKAQCKTTEMAECFLKYRKLYMLQFTENISTLYLRNRFPACTGQNKDWFHLQLISKKTLFWDLPI